MSGASRPAEWYDSAIAGSRRSSVTWWPNGAERNAAGEQLGRVFAATRPTPADVWSPPRLLASEATHDDAAALAVARGCPFRTAEAGS